MKQLNETVAVVTGAGQGIGKGIALCLAKRGVKVIATGRRLEPIEATIAEIRELGGASRSSPPAVAWSPLRPPSPRSASSAARALP